MAGDERDIDYRNRRGGPAKGPSVALGLLSLGLGTAALARTEALAEVIGLPADAAVITALRAVGARELLAAGGLFVRRHPRRWLWARVAGDVMDLGLLAAGARATGRMNQRVLIAGAVLGGAFAIDTISAVRVSRASGQTGADKVIRARAAITVKREPHEVYERWRDLESLPSFMTHLESVRSDGNGHSHWRAAAPAGRTVEWDATIINDRPDELIAWQSDPGSRVPNRGSVRFRAAPGARGTEVAVDLQYEPPGGAIGSLIARALGEEPVQQMKDDLRRFKQILEAGEVARSQAVPEGHTARRQPFQPPATYASDGRD